MIHIRIGGQAFSASQTQRVNLSYQQDTTNTPSAGLAVGVTATQVFDASPVGIASALVTFRNVSGAGQQIGLGFANTVTIANAGILLNAGDEISFDFLDADLWAIASAASGLLSRFSIVST